MDAQWGLMLFGAGLAGGVVTAIVGGASLITFPALLAAGLPPIIANASNTVAMTPGNLMGGLADLERRPRWDRSLLVLLLVWVGGRVAGAVLLLVTPAKAFPAVVPLLIGFATVLFAQSGRIRSWILSRPRGSVHVSRGSGALWFVPVAIYGGYFGAGMSVMLLALLSVSRGDDLRGTNVLKNLLPGLTGGVAVTVFLGQGMVAWSFTLTMMAARWLVVSWAGGWCACCRPRWCASS